jgi:hypothetical protein
MILVGFFQSTVENHVCYTFILLTQQLCTNLGFPLIALELITQSIFLTAYNFLLLPFSSHSYSPNAPSGIPVDNFYSSVMLFHHPIEI